MYTNITTNLISTNCPETMNPGKCPVSDFLKQSKVFHITVNETHVAANVSYDDPQGRNMIIAEIDKIHEICRNCKANNGLQR